MPQAAALLSELQTVLAHGTLARRVETLRRITDFFVDGAPRYSDAQIALFDDVFECLVQAIEAGALATLSQRLAPLPHAPPRIIRRLAFDDAIEVAAPVLEQSTRLDDDALVAAVRSKGQAHMLAIAMRKALAGKVTEALVELGNREVVEAVVGNPGAEVTERGYATLAARMEKDDALAAALARHAALPRRHYLALVAKASDAVRRKLEAAHPQSAAVVASAVREASRRARAEPNALSRETVIAHGLVRSLYEDGRLDEPMLASFIDERKFDETNAALACMAGVSVEIAESIMVEARDEGVLILCKVADLSWPTARAVLEMREQLSGQSLGDVAACRDTFDRLRPTTAQQVLRFHRMQIESAAPASAASAA